jgi:HK97 family phage prohead protease
VPLHWQHRGEARNVIGSADPASMREVAGLGLYVEGKLDLDDSAVARQAWRSMKDNRVGLSFGYMTVKSQRRGGINHLLELDLFEISIAPSPINPQTRILEMKSATITERELRRRCDKLALEAALGWEPITASVDPEPEPKSIPTDTELRRLAAGLGVRLPPRPTSDFDYEAVRRESFRPDALPAHPQRRPGRPMRGRGRSPLRADRAEYRRMGRLGRNSKLKLGRRLADGKGRRWND